MNSEPRRLKTGMVTTIIATAPPITHHFQRSDQRTTGSYRRIRMRLIGCSSSDRIRPTTTVLATARSHAGLKV